MGGYHWENVNADDAFFLGGEYKIENLWAGDPLEGMRFKADLAMQTRHLPEGVKVKLNVAPEPK